jgi:osmotically-inducible protein OsmY
MDQSEDPADIELTAKIRKMVVGDDDLSLLAKNAKIISSGGTVVLRGPVESEAEKKAIAEFARSAGAKKVVNQIEIK